MLAVISGSLNEAGTSYLTTVERLAGQLHSAMLSGREVVMDVVITETGRIPGSRLTVYNIVPFLEEHWDLPKIADLLRITMDQLTAAVKYIEEHRDDVMAVHREIEERIARGNPPEIEAKLEESRARRMAHMEALRRAKAPGSRRR